MNLHIKNMVSLRCKMMVHDELTKLGITYTSISLGWVEMHHVLSNNQKEALKANLLKSGLELLDNKKHILVEKIKNVITEMIQQSDIIPEMNYSDYISDKLKYDYTYLSNLFTAVEGKNIQQFIILHKIEKIKELISYNELNLTEIASKLHYSSVGHLSNQFKKVTGIAPSLYKQMNTRRTDLLENV